MRSFQTLLFLFGVFGISSAFAGPQTLRVTGAIASSTGIPTSSNVDVQVKAYDAMTGGTLLWTSSTSNVAVSNGRFSLNLDASTGSPSLVTRVSERSSSQAIYYQIEIDADAANGTITTPVIVRPRFQASGTTFAITAASADRIRGYAVSTAAPSASQVLTWNNTSSWWEPANPPGKDATYSTEAGRRSSGAIAVYVRTDGSDSTCNGSADASSASAPACAFASVQTAVDAIPEVILHAVTVNVAAGTYRAATSGGVLARIQKQVSAGGSLLIQSTGTVAFSGATSGAPTTPVGDVGLDVYAPTSNLTVKGFSLDGFKVAGLRANSGVTLALNAITASGNDSTSAAGILINQSRAEIYGPIVANSNKYGLSAKRSQIVFTMPSVNITTNNNADTGTYLVHGTEVTTSSTTSTISSVSNAVDGVALLYNSNSLGVGLSGSNNVAGNGVNVGYNSSLWFSGGVTMAVNSNGLSGLLCEKNSTCHFFDGALNASSNPTSNIRVRQGATFAMDSSANMTLTGTNTYAGLEATDMASVLFGTTNSMTISRGSLGAGTGILIDRMSAMTVLSANFTISQYQTYGIRVVNGSSFWDYGTTGGTKTISNATTNASIAELSVYIHGTSPSGTCDGTSRCN